MKRIRLLLTPFCTALVSLLLFPASPASAQKPATATTRTRGEEKRRLEIIRRQNEQLRRAAKLTPKERHEREHRVQVALRRQAAGEKRRQEVARQESPLLQDPAKRGLHQIEEKRQDDLRMVKIARQRRPALLRKAAKERAEAAERKRRREKAHKKPTHRP